MGHHLTEDEQETLENITIFYKNNKNIFLRDLSIFLITTTLLFCLLLQNWIFFWMNSSL